MPSFIQISDTHLFADKTKMLNGANPYLNLEKVFNYIKSIELSYDFLVHTGDCSQDESEDSYKYLRDFFTNLKIKCYFIPGNHDNVKAINKIFNLGWDDGNVNYKFHTGGVDFYFLDSTDYPNCEGKIHKEQFDWINNHISNSGNKNVIFMHHHPIACNSPHMNTLSFANFKFNGKSLSESFHSKNTIAVIFGHIHQEFYKKEGGIEYFGIPATAYQIAPYKKNLEVEKIIPGFRTFSINNNEIESNMIWVS